ncbi:MAG: hypothetical protein ACUVRL_06715 [Candidatus Saccharicenans sp.]
MKKMIVILISTSLMLFCFQTKSAKSVWKGKLEKENGLTVVNRVEPEPNP